MSVKKLAYGLLALLCLVAVTSHAESYPSKPIRMIVPWPAGGTADGAARWLSSKLEPLLGQPIVVENKPGAMGTIAADYVTRTAPDGYTLLRGDSSTHAINPTLFAKLSYDPIKDFTPIIATGKGPMLLLVQPALGVKTLPELIELVKANPGKFNYATPGGTGTPSHLTSEAMKQITGMNMVQVPYKGEAQAYTDLIAGHVQIMFGFTNSSLQLVKTGKLRALVVTHQKRIDGLPQVPTMAEAGFPELEMMAWGGLLAPAGTPRLIVDKLNRAVATVMGYPATIERMRNLGAETMVSTPEEFAGFIKTEIERWGKVVKKSGVRLE